MLSLCAYHVGKPPQVREGPSVIHTCSTVMPVAEPMRVAGPWLRSKSPLMRYLPGGRYTDLFSDCARVRSSRRAGVSSVVPSPFSFPSFFASRALAGAVSLMPSRNESVCGGRRQGQGEERDIEQTSFVPKYRVFAPKLQRPRLLLTPLENLD